MAGGRGKRCASEDTDDSLALRLVDLLNDDQVVAKLRAALYPTELRDEVRELSKHVAILNSQLAEKNARIKTLEDKVDALEYDHDAVEQYSRRPNLRVQGVREMGDGEDTDAMIFDLLNTKMSMDPPIERHHIEQSHRLRPQARSPGWPARRRARPSTPARDHRALLVPQALRRGVPGPDEPQRPQQGAPRQPNLPERRPDRESSEAVIRRTAAKKDNRIADTWTSYRKVMLKLVNGQVKEVKSSNDLNI